MASLLMKRRRAAAAKLRARIIRQIVKGELRPGSAIPPATKLAETYRISYVTAHKALQELAKDGYCRRVAGSGTFVSDNPPMNKVSFVGIPAIFQNNPFHSQMILELQMQATKERVHTIVSRGEDTLLFIKRLARTGVGAMIRYPGVKSANGATETDVWQLLQEHGIKTVMINDFWREGGPFPHVRTEEAAGISEMMDHLIGLGHERILLLTESLDITRSEAVTTHREAFERHGLPYDSSYAIPLFPEWQSSRETVVERVLSKGTAAIVCHDMYALDLAAELDRLGVVLGADFSLAGFDGIAAAEVYGLTTVVQPIEKLASTALSLIRNWSTSETPKIRLKPTCVFRESTGAAPRKH